MSIWYVNSITGSNANSGATMALAKQTLAGVNAVAATGDTVYCHGRFLETIPVSKQLFWYGKGFCEFNGNGLAGVVPISGTRFTRIRFTNWSNAPFYSVTTTFQCFDCKFFGNQYAVYGASPGNITLINCQVYDQTIYGFYLANGTTLNARNCVFFNNVVDLFSAVSSAGGLYHYNCCLGSPVMIQYTNANPALIFPDYNYYDFTNGKCIANGVDKTTLASWKAVLSAYYPAGPNDANSTDSVWRSLVGDYSNRAFTSTPASSLLTAAPGSSPIGLQKPALTISNNTNSSFWTGGIFTNTELDGSGNLQLSAGQTLGTWESDVLDLGANLNIASLDLGITGEDATHLIDTDTSDSPGLLNIELRGRTTSFAKNLSTGTLPYTIIPRGEEVGAYISPSALRYWQIKLTLRG